MSLGQNKSEKSEKAAHFVPRLMLGFHLRQAGVVGGRRGLRHYAAPYCAHRPRPGLRGYKMWSVNQVKELMFYFYPLFLFIKERLRGGVLGQKSSTFNVFFLTQSLRCRMVFVDGDNGQQQQGGGGAALTQLSIRVHPMLGGGTPRRRLSSASRGKCLAAV